jgi:succinate-semialdehyde dehydrogenase/glutarate-semialdehyde dehydrogenase
MPIRDKYTQLNCGELHLPSREQVLAAVEGAHDAFLGNELSAHERGAILDRASDILKLREQEIVDVLIREAGFTQVDASGELARCIQTFKLSAEAARQLTGEMVPIGGAPGQHGRLGFTIRVPLGVVCAITPFNAPLNTVAHKVAPALAAGNALVLKPSTHTPSPAVIMVQALLEAGLPAGMIALINGSAAQAEWLLDDQRIRFYAFTGSTEVGQYIQQRAGLRRTQMELGSIAFTILNDDADLDVALPKIINAAYRKAGQVCTSIQRLLVHTSLISEVETRLANLVGKLSWGDPKDSATVVGPVISQESAMRIEQWIGQAVAGGARLLAGGRRHNAVIAPTLLTDVDAGMPTSCREVFGPVMSIEPFSHLNEAIERVNSTPFGLATGLFTNKLNAALTAVHILQVGGVHINETSSARVDVMPYGGSKDSGFGREGPAYAIREMTEERMVTLRS